MLLDGVGCRLMQCMRSMSPEPQPQRPGPSNAARGEHHHPADIYQMMTRKLEGGKGFEEGHKDRSASEVLARLCGWLLERRAAGVGQGLMSFRGMVFSLPISHEHPASP